MHGTTERTPGSHRSKSSLRRLTAVVTLSLSASVVAGATVASAAPTANRSTVVTVRRTTGSLGKVLVDGDGRTLYVDARDRANHLACTGSCAKRWPPLLLAKGVKRAQAGPGVTDLGTVRRPNGRLEVTSHTMPLYLYVGDRHAGQLSGEGKSGIFFAATPTGKRHSPPGAVPATSSASSTTSTQPSSAVNTTPPQTPPNTPSGSSASTMPAPMAPAATPTSPPATSPPAASPPATSPPPTSPPPTSPPATAPPAGGGVAY
jgi:predicted lipoprotein with Yx(FWY)xxD motif